MMIKDLQPFSVVQDTGFLELLRELEPSYIPPSRNTFITSLLQEKYTHIKTILKSVLEENQFITITTDGWTSSSNESYISITAHFIRKKWEFVSCLLSCFSYSERHTAQNLHEQINEVLNEWGILEKVVAIVTDNAANIVSAAKLGSWAHIPCFAHTLNLIVQYGLDEIKDIRAKVKAVVEHFHRSSQANAKLLSTQTRMDANCVVPLKLKNDVSTRWNSTYFMFERFLKLEEPLTVTVGLLHHPVQLLSQEEWKILKEITQVLKPFELVTTEMSSETCVTVSKIIIIVQRLISILKKYQREMLSDTTKNLIGKLLGSCETRFDKCELNTVLAKSTLLDPRFKLKAFSLEHAHKKVRDKLQDEATALIKRNSENSALRDDGSHKTTVNTDNLASENLIWQEFDLSVKNATQKPSPMATAILELRMYLEDANIVRTENPLLWWKSRELLYPTLSVLAKKYLCIVATSVPSERIFSKAGQIITERRNRLKSKYVNKLVFLNCNQFLFNYKK